MSGTQTHYISTFQDLNAIRTDPQQKIKNYHLLSNQLIKVVTEPVLSYTPPFNKGTLYLCSQVTAVCRINLILAMRKFERNRYTVAYCDTDSMLVFPHSKYCKKPGEIVPIDRRYGSLKVEVENIRFYCGRHTSCIIRYWL